MFGSRARGDCAPASDYDIAVFLIMQILRSRHGF
ncbi:MAG TPA: nucleotidyltransferase domain-containing protein [Candidatus Monoglobus merdigallinarum]|uniref:Nucleotidyltransferase domain-containing protein n=1 Tax=Candidatus Monoglobus merdigallinarum TaxID=2838698 RepID=A0A9D1TLV1_9FIRM|nr:nucleotidyltransferase domain-containing protein [Candidatus Monoglobus merdigallinarum]